MEQGFRDWVAVTSGQTAHGPQPREAYEAGWRDGTRELRETLEAIKRSLSTGFMDLTEAREIAEYIDRLTAEALGNPKDG